MNTINQGPAHPLDRLSAYSGIISWSAGPAPLQGRPGRKALSSARRFGAAPF
ncbi:hypothetical protein [Acidithiobacillus ferridurans]|uniref:hypothetical protein n=1 Tax=Acidithiobacillus ferridurans TaxID=1232575 RepID=UPI001C07A9FE|nr:hypothetical protein [Acidithiobacillus ferridurans]MBU2731269.1 hypothetical protein [Acidithiobacillus ferridurans]